MRRSEAVLVLLALGLSTADVWSDPQLPDPEGNMVGPSLTFQRGCQEGKCCRVMGQMPRMKMKGVRGTMVYVEGLPKGCVFTLFAGYNYAVSEHASASASALQCWGNAGTYHGAPCWAP